MWPPEKLPVSPIIKLDCKWTIGLINEVNFMTFIKVLIFHDYESSEKWDCLSILNDLGFSSQLV